MTQQSQLVTQRSLVDKIVLLVTPAHWSQVSVDGIEINNCVPDHLMWPLSGNWPLESRVLMSQESFPLQRIHECPVLFATIMGAYSATTMVSFPRTDSFASHIIPYNREHATVGLNAPPQGLTAVCKVILLFCEFTNLCRRRGVPYDHEQARVGRGIISSSENKSTLLRHRPT